MRVREKLTYRRRIRAPRVVKPATDLELGLLVFHDADERADESFETTLLGRDSERFASVSLLTRLRLIRYNAPCQARD